MAQIEEALKVDPNNSRAFLSLGAVMQSGESAQAEAAFRKAIELDPASIDAKLALERKGVPPLERRSRQSTVFIGRGRRAPVELLWRLGHEPPLI